MRVFVTGATGFIGSATVKELIAAGHEVTGLARSTEKAKALAAAGAEVLMGTVEQAEILRQGVERADGVIHTAFNHDFSQFKLNCENDRRVIGTLAEALAGSDRPLLVTSGTGAATGVTGRPVTEEDAALSADEMPRGASEEAARAAGAEGVNVTIMRLPQVHDRTRAGLVNVLLALGYQHGFLGYLGDGSNRWPAAHVTDVAQLYRLALEAARPGTVCNAVAEEGIAVKQILEVLGTRLGMRVAPVAPEAAEGYFGWLGPLAGTDLAASSALTRERLGWAPAGPALLDDLAAFEPAQG